MKKTHFIWGVLVFSLLYIILIIRLPKVDPLASTYSVLCSTTLTARGSEIEAFDQIPGKDLNITGTSLRNFAFSYKNPDGDVVAKLICAQGHLPENPQQFYNDAVHTPEYAQIMAGKPNYAIVMSNKVFDPSWGDFIGEILVLIVLDLIASVLWFIFNNKNK